MSEMNIDEVLANGASVAPPKPDFDFDTLLKELTEKAGLGEGLRRRELEKATGMGKNWVLDQLNRLNEEGRLKVVKKKIQTIDGSLTTVPAYRLKNQ